MGKVIRTLHLLTLVLCFVGTKAQSPVILVQDVPAYKQAVRDTKLALERALIASDLDSISYWRSTVVVITQGQRPDTVPLLDDQERTLLNFAISEFPSVLSDIDQRQHFYRSRDHSPYSKYKGEIYVLPSWYTSPSLTNGLRDFWLVRSKAVLESLQGSAMNSQDREFLSLYWMATINSLYNFPVDTIFNQEDIDRRSNVLLAADPAFRYAPIVKTDIRRQFKLARTGIGFAFLGGPNVMLGDLNKQFTNSSNFGINIDVTFDRWMFRFVGMGLDSKLKTDLLVDTAVWHGSKDVFGPSSGGSIGRVLLDDRLGRLVTSIGVSSMRLVYEENKDEKIETASFVQPTVELMYDLKLDFLKPSKNQDAQRTLWTRKEEAYWLLRFRAGFAPVGYGPNIDPQGSIVFLSIGIGGFWRPVRLDKD